MGTKCMNTVSNKLGKTRSAVNNLFITANLNIETVTGMHIFGKSSKTSSIWRWIKDTVVATPFYLKGVVRDD